jgi:hypothetical protein
MFFGEVLRFASARQTGVLHRAARGSGFVVD